MIKCKRWDQKAAVVVTLLVGVIAGCKVVKIPAGGEAALRSGLDMLDQAITHKDWSLVKRARELIAEGKKAGFDREAWYAQQHMDDSDAIKKANDQYLGAFRTGGVICGGVAVLGVVLAVSGVLTAYPKVGVGLIAGGVFGVVLSIVVPELQQRSPIVVISLYCCLGVLFIALTTYLIWHLWKTVKKGAVVINRAKTEIVPEALKSPPDANILTVSAVAREVMDPGVTKVFNVARKQLRAAGETKGDDVIGDECNDPAVK